jgi:hypothetical protein
MEKTKLKIGKEYYYLDEDYADDAIKITLLNKEESDKGYITKLQFKKEDESIINLRDRDVKHLSEKPIPVSGFLFDKKFISFVGNEIGYRPEQTLEIMNLIDKKKAKTNAFAYLSFTEEVKDGRSSRFDLDAPLKLKGKSFSFKGITLTINDIEYGFENIQPSDYNEYIDNNYSITYSIQYDDKMESGGTIKTNKTDMDLKEKIADYKRRAENKSLPASAVEMLKKKIAEWEAELANEKKVGVTPFKEGQGSKITTEDKKAEQKKRDSSKKIKLKEIEIKWAEGDNSKYDKFPKKYTSWSAANKALMPILKDVKESNGGYNKVKFVVVFEDGEDYAGRLDVSEKEDSPELSNNAIGKHIYDYVIYSKDPKSGSSEETRKGIDEWLNKYDLGLSDVKDKKTSKGKNKKPVMDDSFISDTLMGIDNIVWEKLKIKSGDSLYANKELQKKYKSALDKDTKSLRRPFSKKVHDQIEDNNSHSLNQYLYLSGAYGEAAKKDWIKTLENARSLNHFLDASVFGVKIDRSHTDDVKTEKTTTSTSKEKDYDCDEIIAKAKAKKAKAKKSANKPEVTKSKNAVEKVTSGVKNKYKDGELTQAQIKSLIKELQDSIKELEKLLKTAPENFAKGGAIKNGDVEKKNFQEIDGSKYFVYDFDNKGNEWSVLIAWGKYNHVNVTKKTNNPFGNKLGAEFNTIGEAVDNYKDVNIKGNILFAGNEAKKYGYMPKHAKGATIESGVDLFEDPDSIPSNVQKILDAHEDDFMNGNYEGLKTANEKLKKIGYTFDYYLDGQAYDLRKIGQKGKSEGDSGVSDEAFKKGGAVESANVDFSVSKNKDNVVIIPLTMKGAEYFATKMMRSKYQVYRKEVSVDYYHIGNILEEAEKDGLKFTKSKTEKLAKGGSIKFGFHDGKKGDYVLGDLGYGMIKTVNKDNFEILFFDPNRERYYLKTIKKGAQGIVPAKKEGYTNSGEKFMVSSYFTPKMMESYPTTVLDFAKGGAVKSKITITNIKDIPNLTKRIDEGSVTYRGLGMDKLSNDFYELAGESGTRIKVDGKEYFITDTDYRTLNWDDKNKKWLGKIKFDAPYRKFKKGGTMKKANKYINK